MRLVWNRETTSVQMWMSHYARAKFREKAAHMYKDAYELGKYEESLWEALNLMLHALNCIDSQDYYADHVRSLCVAYASESGHNDLAELLALKFTETTTVTQCMSVYYDRKLKHYP